MRGRARARWLFAGYGVIVLMGACANVDTTLTPPTEINLGVTAMSVDPMTFLGGVTCSDVDGGSTMASYVATIIDVTDPENPFTLPSSPPTPCSQLTYFQNVNPGDVYVAEIDGYTQQAKDLVPLCGALPPGPLLSCTSNNACPEAYGCLGACKVTTYRNANLSCFTGCGADEKCASTCGQILGPTADGGVPDEAAELAAFEGCLADKCKIEVDGGCVAANNFCLTTQFDALQNDCGEVPQPGTANDPTVLQGAVKACLCVYVPTEGARQQYLAADATKNIQVTPAWQTSCAEGSPVQSQLQAEVPIEPCVPLAANLTGSTSLVVVPDATLGELSCATSADAGVGGPVTGFAVYPSDKSLAPALSLPCPSGAGVVYNNVTPETNYSFKVYAYQGGATPSQSADCQAFPAFGTVTAAMCDVLIPLGSGP